jgi:hypothetical protein
MGKKNKHEISKSSIADLCKEVNSFDMQFGIKLKNINPASEPEFVFQEFIMSFQDFIYSVLCKINGISPDKYLKKKNRIAELGDAKFTELSNLNWDDKCVYNVKSYEFKCRFLTIFLLDYVEKLEDIALHK